MKKEIKGKNNTLYTIDVRVKDEQSLLVTIYSDQINFKDAYIINSLEELQQIEAIFEENNIEVKLKNLGYK